MYLIKIDFYTAHLIIHGLYGISHSFTHFKSIDEGTKQIHNWKKS